MSLADELAAEKPKLPSIVDDWLTDWYPTLSDADKETFDRAVADPKQPAAAIFRVCKRRGYPGSDPMFRKWVKEQRDLKFNRDFR